MLIPIQESEWEFPSFIIPKKPPSQRLPGTVRFPSDLRELNKCIIRKPYPLPEISTALQEIEVFTYAMASDLNMDYYTIRLDPATANMCTIFLPWGTYSYERLSMGA